MNRFVMCLQVGVLLVVAGWLGATSSYQLLHQAESAVFFQINLKQASSSGGCLTEVSTPCPAWEDPNSEDTLCGCTGEGDDTSCSPAEAEGDDEDGATVYNTITQNYNGFGFGSSIWTPTLCTAFYTCQEGCVGELFGDRFSCNVEQVSGFVADGYKVDTDNYAWCNVLFYVHHTKAPAPWNQTSGIGMQLFRAE